MKLSIITPTHRPKHLKELWDCIRAQSHDDWEWVIFVNHKSGSRERIRDVGKAAREVVGTDRRVRIEYGFDEYKGNVGAIKKAAFSYGDGDVLVEVDHDDLITPDCLSEISQAFQDSEVGFVYSDWADFQDDAVVPQGFPTYRRTDQRPRWEANRFRFYQHHFAVGDQQGHYECVSAFEPSALSLSLIYWAPNHVRAWRRSVYEFIGGHDSRYVLCDDHELLIRTYLATKFHHITKPLYLYRVHTDNTFDNEKNAALIEKMTYELREAWIEKLVLRECELSGRSALTVVRPGSMETTTLMTPIYLRESIKGWKPVEFAEIYGKDRPGSLRVGALMLNDTLQHFSARKQDSIETMWSLLEPGGHLMAFVPSTDGKGAFMDPRHQTYWNNASFWYWTRGHLHEQLYGESSRYRFQESELKLYYPSEWHNKSGISYVRAHLVALKGDYEGPGEVLF